MSDLENLAYYCRTMADTKAKRGERAALPGERRLWAQIATEIDGYLGIHDATEPGLFEATS
jgi:hypothetical protein